MRELINLNKNKMNLLKEAFIEGYKQRAEGSDLIFDNASRMYAISLFDKYQAEQLTLTDVVPSSCLFNGQRRAVIKQTESFYFFAVGNSFKWNYAEKHLCTDLKHG